MTARPVVLAVIAEACRKPVADLCDDTPLADLGDSLRRAEIWAEIYDRLDVDVGDAPLEGGATVGELVALVERMVRR